MEIILGVSNRHIHLTEEDYKLDPSCDMRMGM